MSKSVTLKTACKAAFLVASLSSSGFAAAALSASAAAPVNNPGLVGNLVSTTGLTTGATIGATVGSIAGGGGGNTGFGLASVNRFALPGQGDTGAAAAPGIKPVNAWFALSRNNVAYDYAPLKSSGKVDVAVVGVDYTFDNKVVLGVAVAVDRTDVDLNFSGGKLKGDGTTVSPYIGIPLNKNWSADASVGFGRTRIETTDSTANGKMDDDRTVGTLGITYRQAADKWLLSGRAAYLAVKDKLGAYTMSNGSFIQSGSVNVSQLRLGASAAYNAGWVSPHIGLNYIYDISAPKQDGASNDRDAFQAVAGLRFQSKGAAYGGIQYSTELSRSQIKNDQFMINVGARF